MLRQLSAEPSSILAGAAAIAAWVAALFAYRTFRVTRRQLELQEGDYLARRPDLVPYLAHVWYQVLS